MSSEAFITAAFNGDLSRVHALVADADEGALKTALVNAANQGHADVVELLLAKGADVNARLGNGYTSLTMACRGKHWNVAKLLIANGADVNIPTGNGYTSLIFAASEGQPEIVEALLAEGADVNVKTIVGTTALFLASNKDVVEMLRKAGGVTGLSSDPVPSSPTPAEKVETSDGDNVTETLLEAMTLLRQEQPVEAAECLLPLPTGENEQVIALKKAAAVALANHAVSFSNEYLGQLTQEMSRNGWDGGYNLGAAQERARNLKYKTITWLKIASALDPSNSQISGLIDSYFKMHVTTLADRELLKR